MMCKNAIQLEYLCFPFDLYNLNIVSLLTKHERCKLLSTFCLPNAYFYVLPKGNHIMLINHLNNTYTYKYLFKVLLHLLFNVYNLVASDINENSCLYTKFRPSPILLFKNACLYL